MRSEAGRKENHKLTAKPFPVKKYGLERAKVEVQRSIRAIFGRFQAFGFFKELEDAGRLGRGAEFSKCLVFRSTAED